MRLRGLLIALIVVACSDDASDVTGRATYQYLGRPDEEVRDLSRFEFRAYVHQTSSFLVYPPVLGTASGTFAIPGVHDGTLLLRVVSDDQRAIWSEHEDHSIEFVTRVLGRPGLVTPQLITPVALQLSGLAPWTIGDQLYVDCWTNGTEASGLQTLISPPPTNGDTSLDGSFNWNSLDAYSFGPSGRPYLMDMSAGDTLTVSRTHAEQSNSVAIQTLVQVASGPASTQTDGQQSSFAASFDTPPQNQLIHLTADLPSIAQQFEAPTGTWLITVFRGPGAATGLTMGPPLLELRGASLDTALDVSRTFADPFDSSWDLVVSSVFQHQRSLQIPGITSAVSFTEGIQIRQRVAADQDLVAPIGLLSELRINGTEIRDDAHVPWNGSSALTIRATLPKGVVGFDLSVVQVTSEVSSTEIVHLHALHDEVVLPADNFTRGTPYALLATLTYDDGKKVAISKAVWGPVVLE